MKLTNELLDQIIEAARGTYNPETGEFEYIDDDDDDFEDDDELDDDDDDEDREMEVVGTYGGRKQYDREMKQPAGRGIQLPKVKMAAQTHAQGKPIDRYPPSHPLAGKPMTKGYFDQMTAAAIEKDRTEREDYEDYLRSKKYTRFEETKFKMTKNDILEMIKEEITNILNGD